MKEGIKFILTYVGILVGGLAVLAIAGCAKRDVEAKTSPSRDVVCYSGGKVVYQGRVVGNVWRDGSGLVFTDKATGQSVLTTADCVIGTEIPIVQD